jgi:hypothetical protein
MPDRPAFTVQVVAKTAAIIGVRRARAHRLLSAHPDRRGPRKAGPDLLARQLLMPRAARVGEDPAARHHST